jgi:hypothetical protein
MALLVLATAWSAPGFAENDDQSTQPKEQSTQPKEKEKLVCKTQTVTGSLLRKKRICMTQSDWDELAANTRRDVDNYTNNLASKPIGASNPAAAQ